MNEENRETETAGEIARAACSYSDECHHQNYEGPYAITCPGCADITSAIQDQMDKHAFTTECFEVASEQLETAQRKLRELGKLRDDCLSMALDLEGDTSPFCDGEKWAYENVAALLVDRGVLEAPEEDPKEVGS